MSYIQSLKNDYKNFINIEKANGSIVIDPNKHALLRKIEAISIIIFNELDKLFVKKLHFCTDRQKLIVEILEYNNRNKLDDANMLEYRKHLINTGLVKKNPKNEKYFIGDPLEMLMFISLVKNHLRAIQTIFVANSQFFNSSNNQLPENEGDIKVPFVISNNTEVFCINMLKWNNKK